MKLLDEIIQEKDEYFERFNFAVERIKGIYNETETNNETLRCHGEHISEYFHFVSKFLIDISDLYDKTWHGVLADYSLAKWQELNKNLYSDVTGHAYDTSFANPTYAKKVLGDTFYQELSTLYTELRSNIVYAFENRLFYLTTSFELFIEIYNIMENADATSFEVRNAIYYYFFDYADVTIADSLHDSFDPARNFATDIICGCDLSDLRYLYYFGEYISENEIKTAEYLNSLSEDKIRDMAKTFSDGYFEGFKLYDIDLSKKKTVNIRYHIGMERMVRQIINNFKEEGLMPIIYRAGVSISKRNLRGKIGYYGGSPNKQYEYDHRMDDAIFFDKAYADRKLSLQKMALEEIKDLCNDFAGPALIETFGEMPFNPKDKEESFHYSSKQQKLKVNFQSSAGLLLNEYVPSNETSFSIISYPLPEIGEQYQEIFDATIKVNTLDQKKYLEIQTKIIDALDKGDFVRITGRGNNKTNLSIALSEISNPNKETKFENCLADVNIPLGEVFTSPKLNGTDGILHVTKVYLNDLEYHDLELTFKDGIIKDYTCANFGTDEENKKYILENVLFHHETLPMGEFAIGTNTTAYAMGKKYNISHLLPILIAEKTGPHFAVGDTCFSHEEDLDTFNPDGKKMIAKENDYSKLRNENPQKAYFNCHTDITIPYDELGDIIVVESDGTETFIIKEGKFVLDGTEQLNDVL